MVQASHPNTPGESGKSTVFKQMRVIHSGGYTQEELNSFKWIVQKNVLDGIRMLLQKCTEYGLELGEDAEDAADAICLWEGENLNPKLAEHICIAWADGAVQHCFDRRADFQLGDSTKHFLDQVERLGANNYVPTVDDVLHSRVRTSGVVSKDFVIGDKPFQMFDVGGQRSERRRWIHTFDHVDAVVFVAALSEYNQMMAEDASKNRLVEALDLFEQIANSHYFASTNIILFLNKKDLFEEKVKKVDPAQWFPDYTGGCNYEAAEAYFRAEFQKRIHKPEEADGKSTKTSEKKRDLYPYTTCATDTGNIKFVFDAMQSLLMAHQLGAYGG